MAFDVSKINIPLGFGCMRFDGRADDTVDIAQVSEMIDCYMEAGRIIATSLSFYIPQISFFRLIHAAYYHESIIVHIKSIFYNDI